MRSHCVSASNSFPFLLFPLPPPPNSTLFPYTTLFRSVTDLSPPFGFYGPAPAIANSTARVPGSTGCCSRSEWEQQDRKSTRLNSSHRCISYAVFCLKKKKYH